MNQAVYFCTGELQPALYAHYGLAMERGESQILEMALPENGE